MHALFEQDAGAFWPEQLKPPPPQWNTSAEAFDSQPSVVKPLQSLWPKVHVLQVPNEQSTVAMQSAPVKHCAPHPHFWLQPWPQSMSGSLPFCTPSKQLGTEQVPLPQTRLWQSLPTL